MWNEAQRTLLILSGLALPVVAQHADSLSINGQTGTAKVIQLNGRNYVEVEGLARLTNSSISFNGNQIIITLAGGNPPAHAAPTGFSKEFITASLEAMAQQREWHAALKNAIESAYPISDNWLSGLRAKAQQALHLASISASTPADRKAAPLINNQFENMSKLSAKYLQMAQSMTYINPRSLDTDGLDQKIAACIHSLSAMATANQFVEDGSCQ